MNCQCIRNLSSKQKGMALIMLLLVIALVSVTSFFRYLDATKVKMARDRKTALALLQGKTALIAWSSNQSTPGILPCPEDVTLIGTLNEGSAKSSCSNTLPSIGRLPWKTIGMGDLRDGNGDKLWYAISSGFRGAPINLNSLGKLTLDGQSNEVLAIIFSPGVPLKNQNRLPENQTNQSHYLDLANSGGTNFFVSKGSPVLFNDKLIPVTRNELFRVVNMRVLGEIRGDTSQGLRKYFVSAGKFAFADINADGDADANQVAGSPSYNGVDSQSTNSLFFSTSKKQMLVNNGWMQLVHYELNHDRQKVILTLGQQTLLVEAE